MFKPLSAGLAQWRPVGRGISAIDAIRSGWPSIVGVEVARNSSPSEITGNTVVIVTRSGAWSQQLSFLEARILAGICEIPEARAMTALRFRVGRLTPNAPVPAAQTGLASPQVRRKTAYRPADTLADVIHSLEQHVIRRNAYRGPRCRRCRVPLSRADVCAPCRDQLQEARRVTLLRLLTQTPWLGDDEIRKTLGSAMTSEIMHARNILLTRWFAELERLRRKKRFEPGEPERATAVAYVLMRSGLPPDHLTPALARYVLGPQLDAILYEDSSS